MLLGDVMLTQEENHLVTRTGPKTPAGEVLRRYWQPAALVEELPPERPIKALTLLGEDLVLYRDEQGRYGLLGWHCSHRGADLSSGRLEDGGLRCLYHGWLYNVDGRCLEQPAEPEASQFCDKIRHTAYPCEVRNGIVFAYMGPGAPPRFPGYDCFVAPDAYTFAFKGFIDCNWLQGLEGGIDPSHVSFLHRFFIDEDPDTGYGQQFRDHTASADIPVTKILRDIPRPQLEVEPTPYGLRLFALRRMNQDHMHMRVTNLIFPNAIAVPMSKDMVITQWHVPIDDRRSWWYAIFYDFSQRVDKAKMRQQRLTLYTLPDYIPRRHRSNHYGFDYQEQRDLTYTGMGMDINVHDTWAVESAGVIQDRTVEHLGAADKGITAYRRILLRTIRGLQQREEQPQVGLETESNPMTGPAAIDAIVAVDTWQTAWQTHELNRRDASEWARASSVFAGVGNERENDGRA